MKINMPVTNREVELREGSQIVTKTDTNGVITYANRDFVEISGFSEQELIGSNHHIVRHPDMPPAAFADLWENIKAGNPWSGLVKNRCKSGDFYWVLANVAPLIEGGSRHRLYLGAPQTDPTTNRSRGKCLPPVSRRQGNGAAHQPGHESSKRISSGE